MLKHKAESGCLKSIAVDNYSQSEGPRLADCFWNSKQAPVSGGDNDKVHNNDSGKATGTEVKWGSKSGETHSIGEW